MSAAVKITFILGWTYRVGCYITINAFTKKSFERFFNKTVFTGVKGQYSNTPARG